MISRNNTSTIGEFIEYLNGFPKDMLIGAEWEGQWRAMTTDNEWNQVVDIGNGDKAILIEVEYSGDEKGV
jgi:hypothetical protein